MQDCLFLLRQVTEHIQSKSRKNKEVSTFPSRLQKEITLKVIPLTAFARDIIAHFSCRAEMLLGLTSVSKAQGCVLSQHKRSYNIHRERREGGGGVGRILIISPFWMKSDLHVSFSLFGSVSLCMPMWSDIQHESRTWCLCVYFFFIFSSIPA